VATLVYLIYRATVKNKLLGTQLNRMSASSLFY